MSSIRLNSLSQTATPVMTMVMCGLGFILLATSCSNRVIEGSYCATALKSDALTSTPSQFTDSAQRVRHSENPFHQSRFFKNNSEQVSLQIQANPAADTTTPEKRVYQNHELAVLIDHSCVRSGSLKKLEVRERHPDQNLQTLRFRDSIDSAEIETLLSSDPCVLGVNEEIRFTHAAIGSPTYEEQDHLYSTMAYKLFDSTTFPDSLFAYEPIVAVIDSGVDRNHPQLSQPVWINSKERTGRSGVDDDGNGYVDDIYGYNFASRRGDPRPSGTDLMSSHGTHVAGLIAANPLDNDQGIRGIFPRAKVMALNVFGNSGYTSAATIDEAIRYATANGADIINLSLGGPGYSATTESAIAAAINQGIIVITAAGNDGISLSTSRNQTNYYTPASMGPSFAGLITVGSVDSRAIRRSFFSNFSPTVVEIAAPGSENSYVEQGLLSTIQNGAYARMEGTSMSAPIVSGAAAAVVSLLRSRNQTFHPSQMEQLLAAFAKAQSELSTFFYEGHSIDIYQPIQYLMQNQSLDNLPENRAPEKPRNIAPTETCSI